VPIILQNFRTSRVINPFKFTAQEISEVADAFSTVIYIEKKIKTLTVTINSLLH